MSSFTERGEAATVKYLRHVIHNGSFNPLTTGFLISCVVIGLTAMDRLSHVHAIIAELATLIILLYFADRRDQKIANAGFQKQLEAVRALVATSATEASEMATVRSDIQDTRDDIQQMSMHAQDVQIAAITDSTKKDT